MRKIFIASLLVLAVSGAAFAASSTVYFTKDISPAGIMAIYNKLGREATGKVAVKLSTGEAGNTHYLDPNLIKELVQKVNGTIVECNTAYGGSRASTALHRQVIEDHGFNAIAKVDIMDEEGEISLPVVGGKHLKEDVVGSHFKDYDFVLVLTHFKGHAMGGFGGALKNISIGIASSRGKVIIHTAGTRDSGSIWYDNQIAKKQDEFLESMAEAAKAVYDSLDGGKKIMFISVMNHLSVDCDCDGNPAAPDMHDIGILGSLDPVALDQACVDLVYKAPDGASLIRRMEAQHGIHILEHASSIGFGNRDYNLVNID
ncbi:MAG: DUF362 domain-containing protein [Synergistaceae bacterium]|nr:DUF362 domain-containing protein [Synergistaceae bacterium]